MGKGLYPTLAPYLKVWVSVMFPFTCLHGVPTNSLSDLSAPPPLLGLSFSYTEDSGWTPWPLLPLPALRACDLEQLPPLTWRTGLPAHPQLHWLRRSKTGSVSKLVLLHLCSYQGPAGAHVLPRNHHLSASHLHHLTVELPTTETSGREGDLGDQGYKTEDVCPSRTEPALILLLISYSAWHRAGAE